MENFYLEKKETLFSIIDRIKRSRDNNIVLVVPNGLITLKSIVNLKILKEEALSLDKNISISTSDFFIKNLIEQAGLELVEVEKPEIKPRKIMSDIVKPANLVDLRPKKVVEKPVIEEPVIEEPVIEEPEEKTPYGRPLDDLGAKEEEFKELFEKEKEQESEILETEYKFEEPKSHFKIFTKKRVIGAFLIFGIIGLGLISYFILPRVQIVLDPKKETIRFEADIMVDKDVDSVDANAGIIPGQVFEIEMQDSRTFPTTGEKDLEEKARGFITIYNEYSSEEQALVKTTRFLSNNGKLFRLIETTVIPGASIVEGQIIPSSKEIEIIADEPGEAYNIGPTEFTIPGFKGSPKYTGFRGESSESMSGGIKGRVKIATKDDIDGAKEIVSLELKEKVYKEFIKKIPKELTLLENAQVLDIIESSSTLEPDNPGKDFTITIKAKAWGLAFLEQDTIKLIEDNLVSKVSDNKVLLPSTITIDYKNPEIDFDNGKIGFTCESEVKVAWNLDKEVFKNDLAGKNEIEVRKYLSNLSEIESAKVIFWPFWVKRVPVNKNKIKIIIDIES